MAERPDPEYDWLYGKKRRKAPEPTEGTGEEVTRPVPRSAPEESTRVMPTMEPPRRQRPPEDRPLPGRNEIAPTPGDPGPPPRPPRRTRRRRFPFRRPGVLGIIGLLLLAWVAFLVIVPIVTWSNVEKVAWEPSADRPDDQPGTTYLMVGSDSRAGLTKAERQRLHTGGAAGGRTDTIMLLHTGDGPNLLMSLPRDSIVDIPGHGTGKINAAYAYGGPKLLTRTVEQATGIRVDHYVEIGMGGVAGVVDAVGGIEICPQNDMNDPQAGLDIKKGCQEADGVTALGYARSRHTSNFGDLARARQQREVVAAVGKKVVSPWTVVNPLRYWNLNQAVPDLFTFGEGSGVVTAGRWAMAMTSPDLTCGVPIADMAVNWDAERSERMFGYIIEDRTDDIPAALCTPTGLPKSVTG